MARRLQHAIQTRVKHAVEQMGKNPAMTIKARIQQRMDELDMNVATTAKGAGVSRSAVYQWLSGDTEPGIAAIVKLAEALKTYEKWIVFGKGPKDRGAWVALEPDEAALLLAYKDLNADTKEAIYTTARELAASDRKKGGGKAN